MKRIFVICIALITISYSYAQEFKTEFKSKSDNRKVKIIIDNSKLNISQHSGNEVIIEADGYKPPPERVQGLRPLYNSAVDNSGIGLSVTEEDNVLKIVRASSKNDVDYNIKLPQSIGLCIETGFQSEDIEIKDFVGELEIENKTGDIKLENVTGPLVLETMSGDITVTFSELSQKGPSSINAMSGFVDVTFPENSKANFKLKSMTGEIYVAESAAIELVENKKEDEEKHPKKGTAYIDGEDETWSVHLNHSYFHKTLKAKMNGGGVDFQIDAMSDDIYLRIK